MKTILAPVDFSSSTAPVVAEATTLARSLSARVVLLTVIQPPLISGEYAPLLENMAEVIAASEKAAANHLARLQAELKAQEISSETVQLKGGPVAHIVEQAKTFQADYIVMGSHGHTALYDLLVGSTTHGVLLRAPCPVVILPASGQEKKTAGK